MLWAAWHTRAANHAGAGTLAAGYRVVQVMEVPLRGAAPGIIKQIEANGNFNTPRTLRHAVFTVCARDRRDL